MQGTTSQRPSTVLVLAGTDSDSTRLALALAGARFTVRAVIGNPQSVDGFALRTAGVDVMPGSLEDRAAIRSAIRGSQFVVAITSSDLDAAGELQCGRNVINAVAASEVDYFVLCSGQDELEIYMTTLDLPATFIRITAEPHVRCDCERDDLGAIVILLLDQPGVFVGQRIGINLQCPISERI